MVTINEAGTRTVPISWAMVTATEAEVSNYRKEMVVEKDSPVRDARPTGRENAGLGI